VAEITLTIPDAIVPRILDAFDGMYGERGTMSKAAWAKKWVRNYIREVVRHYEAQEASVGVAEAAETAADEATEGIS